MTIGAVDLRPNPGIVPTPPKIPDFCFEVAHLCDLLQESWPAKVKERMTLLVPILEKSPAPLPADLTTRMNTLFSLKMVRDIAGEEALNSLLQESEDCQDKVLKSFRILEADDRSLNSVTRLVEMYKSGELDSFIKYAPKISSVCRFVLMYVSWDKGVELLQKYEHLHRDLLLEHSFNYVGYFFIGYFESERFKYLHACEFALSSYLNFYFEGQNNDGNFKATLFEAIKAKVQV